MMPGSSRNPMLLGGGGVLCRFFPGTSTPVVNGASLDQFQPCGPRRTPETPSKSFVIYSPSIPCLSSRRRKWSTMRKGRKFSNRQRISLWLTSLQSETDSKTSGLLCYENWVSSANSKRKRTMHANNAKPSPQGQMSASPATSIIFLPL